MLLPRPQIQPHKPGHKVAYWYDIARVMKWLVNQTINGFSGATGRFGYGTGRDKIAQHKELEFIAGSSPLIRHCVVATLQTGQPGVCASAPGRSKVRPLHVPIIGADP